DGDAAQVGHDLLGAGAVDEQEDRRRPRRHRLAAALYERVSDAEVREAAADRAGGGPERRSRDGNDEDQPQEDSPGAAPQRADAVEAAEAARGGVAAGAGGGGQG